MKDSEPQIERKYLRISAAGNLIIGSAALVFAFISDSQAILLDGVFNLIFFITGLITLKVVELVSRRDDRRYPFGYAVFEPLVNGIKGALMIGITLLAVVGSIIALFKGGRPISGLTALIYGIFVTVACWLFTIFSRRGAKRNGSPMMVVDSENWLVNSFVSSCVLIALALNYYIQGTSLNYLSPYVDPSLVLITSALAISVPVRISTQSLREILGAGPTDEIYRNTEKIVRGCLTDHPIKDVVLRVLQTGRTRTVLVHIILPTELQLGAIENLDRIRNAINEKLRKEYSLSYAEIVFTSNQVWNPYQLSRRPRGAAGEIQAVE